MDIFFNIMIFLLGLGVGSFINMAVYRVNKNESFLGKKRSFCDYCGKQLHWYENIPVLSWLFLLGKAKCCRKQLSILYPMVELGTGILFVLNYELRITNYELILGFIVIATLVFLMIFDGKYMLLPENVLYFLLMLGMLKNILDSTWINVVVGVSMGAVFWLLSKIKIKGHDAMGDGDAYLATFIGWWLGWQMGLVALYFAFIVGSIYGVVLLIIGRAKKLDPIPFGPFLIGGILFAWFNSEIVLYYLNRWF